MQTTLDNEMIPENVKGLVLLLRHQVEQQEFELRKARKKLEKLLSAHNVPRLHLVVSNEG